MGFFSGLFGSKPNNQTKKNATASAATVKPANTTRRSLFGRSKPNAAAKAANNAKKQRNNATIKAMNRASLSPNLQVMYDSYMELNTAKKNLEASYKATDDIIATLDYWIAKLRPMKLSNMTTNFKKKNFSTWPYVMMVKEDQKEQRAAIYKILKALGEPDYSTYEEKWAAESETRDTSRESLRAFLETAKKNQIMMRKKLQEGVKAANGSQLSEGEQQVVNRKLKELAEKLVPTA